MSPRSSGVSGVRSTIAAIARQLPSDRLQRLPCDLERVRGRERVLIGGHDRHYLRAETCELLAEQIEMAVRDHDRRRALGILLERRFEQAIIGACRKRAGDGALQRLLGLRDLARDQQSERGRGHKDAQEDT